VIGAAILGILAGYLARALLPGKQEMGFFATVLLGLVGSLVGFFFFTEVLGIGDTEAFDLGGLVGAVIGAMLVLFVYDRVVASRGAKAQPTKAPAQVSEGAGREPRGERSGQGRDRPERDRPRRDNPDR
jgi:uncharacterized membrane protein YeaQ/YmgE (transglycosylase-associated protein family)